MTRRRYRVLLGLAALALLLLVLIGAPTLALRALGLVPLGTVEEVLAATSAPATPTPVGDPLDEIVISSSEGEAWTVSREGLGVVEMNGGLDPDGEPAYRLVFDEAGFNRYFQSDMAPWLPWKLDLPCRDVWFDLREGGLVIRASVDVGAQGDFSLPRGVPYLGVRFGYTEEGVELLEVLALGPADQAGLQVGDVIVELEGTPVAEAPYLTEWTQEHHAPGDVVSLGVLRGDQEITVEVELGEWAEDERWHDLGLVLAPDVTGSRLVPIGLSVGEELYSLPRNGFLATAVTDVQDLLDGFLEELTVVGPLQGEAHVAWLGLEQDRLTIVLR